MTIKLWITLFVWIIAAIAMGYIVGFEKKYGELTALFNWILFTICFTVGMAIKYFNR